MRMSETDQARLLLAMERELADDRGVRTAIDAFDEAQVRWPRRTVVTLFGVFTALAVIGTGHATNWAGALVLTIMTVAVVDAHRVERPSRGHARRVSLNFHQP